MDNLQLPILVVAGIIAYLSLYAGKLANRIKLPSLIGFMFVGVFLGPSLAGLLSSEIQDSMQFITKIALGFVALSIGMELHIRELRRQGPGIMLVILTESFGAFLVVGLAVFLLTGDPALALIFGGIAPASAPAGTVAIIQEYRARGPLTKALYTVVGFDDGLGIIIFGFAFAVAKAIISSRTGLETMTLSAAVISPLREIGLSILVGLVMVLVYTLLSRPLDSARDRFILTIATVLFTTGMPSSWIDSRLAASAGLGKSLLSSKLSRSTTIKAGRSAKAWITPRVLKASRTRKASSGITAEIDGFWLATRMVGSVGLRLKIKIRSPNSRLATEGWSGQV